MSIRKEGNYEIFTDKHKEYMIFKGIQIQEMFQVDISNAHYGCYPCVFYDSARLYNGKNNFFNQPRTGNNNGEVTNFYQTGIFPCTSFFIAQKTKVSMSTKIPMDYIYINIGTLIHTFELIQGAWMNLKHDVFIPANTYFNIELHNEVKCDIDARVELFGLWLRQVA